MSKIKTSVVTITPDTAKEWLARGGKNRSIKQHVARIKDDILAGRWALNGQPIILDCSGAVLDGQHRLTACVQAGLPIESLVVFGADRSVFDTLDNGSARSAADIIGISGVKNAGNVAGTTRIITWYDEAYKSDLGHYAARMSPTVINQNAERYGAQGLFAIVSRIKAHKGITSMLPVGPLSAVMFIAYRDGHKDAADRFLSSLESGADLAVGDPILTLRQRVITAKALGKRILPQEMFSLILKAWGAYVKGESVQVLRIGRTERVSRPPSAWQQAAQ